MMKPTRSQTLWNDLVDAALVAAADGDNDDASEQVANVAFDLTAEVGQVGSVETMARLMADAYRQASKAHGERGDVRAQVVAAERASVLRESFCV